MQKVNRPYSALLIFCVSIFLSACEILKPKAKTPDVVVTQETEKPAEKPEIYKAKIYKSAAPIVWKQEHTKLKISFDVENQTATADAELTFAPNIESKRLVIDAVGFDFVSAVELIHSTKDSLKIIDVDYNDSLHLKLAFSETCSREDTLTIKFKYTAKPNSLYKRGLINDAANRGLHFINPYGTELDKPTQIWTQGETKSNSCWMPCIDEPNQKTSQEIYITVDTPFVALSNGRQVYILLNDDGTRTFYWKQEKKHAPYLTMMAVGKFAIIEDETKKGLPLSYYVEPEYAKYARLIFGKTEEIISFFEGSFGYEYPWDKYAQVCVRDFTSGAMENTSATTIMERIQQDNLKIADYNYEDYIVHELAHQWFGDLVTCEAWSNLALNEAFATYGEYLWIEHKYGKIKAQEKLQSFQSAYFGEASIRVHPLINYHYHERDEMFNRHSYQKGALFLHALRTEVGDTFFFDGLAHYLKKHEYETTDIAHLRHAFEDVSGLDLSGFFDIYALTENHPNLLISHSFADTTATLHISCTQTQAYAGYTTYGLEIPISIILENGKEINETLIIDASTQDFIFKTQAPVSHLLINTDQNPLIQLKTEFNKQHCLNMLSSQENSVRVAAVTIATENWDTFSKTEKTELITVASSLGRDYRLMDIKVINACKQDSQFFDLTPLLKSKQNFVVSSTISYLSTRNAISSSMCESLLKQESYYIKLACIRHLGSHYNAGVEKTLTKEYSTLENEKLKETIIDFFALSGSVEINNILKKYYLNNTESSYNSYANYLFSKGFATYKNNVDFFKTYIKNNKLNQAQIDSLKKELYALSAKYLDPSEQAKTSEIIENL